MVDARAGRRATRMLRGCGPYAREAWPVASAKHGRRTYVSATSVGDLGAQRSRMRRHNGNGRRDALTPDGPDTGECAPMPSSVSHGAASASPSTAATACASPGLYARTRADGSTVYDVALRLGGKVRRHRLTANTKTDAIAELRALQTDYSRGQNTDRPRPRSPSRSSWPTSSAICAPASVTPTRSVVEPLAPSSITSTSSAATCSPSSGPPRPRM